MSRFIETFVESDETLSPGSKGPFQPVSMTWKATKP